MGMNTATQTEWKGLYAGTVLTSSWGYDQTNVDFYEVLSRKGDWVSIQRIGSKETPDGGPLTMTGTVVPDPAVKIGKPMRRRAVPGGYGEEYCKGEESYKYCHPWNGKPRRVSHYA